MAKIGKAIARGVQAGLLHYGAKLEKDEAQKREDERLAKQDQFRERELSIRERDADLRAAAAERQKKFDDIKLDHAKLTERLASSNGNVNAEAQALTDSSHDTRIYRFDKKGGEEKGLWGQMKVSYLDRDPITGEVKVDPLTGMPMEITTKAPTDTIDFKTRGDYEDYKATVSSGPMYTALSLKRLDERSAIKQANALAETIEGKSKRDLRAAQTEESKARAEKLRAEARGDVKTPGQMPQGEVDAIGGPIKRTQKEMDKDNRDAKAVMANYSTVTSTDEAFRINQIKNDKNIKKRVGEEIAKIYLAATDKNKLDRLFVRNSIADDFRVSQEFVEDLLRAADKRQEEIKANEPGVWDTIFDTLF